VAEVQGQFKKQQEGEHLLLEAIMRGKMLQLSEKTKCTL
jgi:hypothetical protein